MRPIFTAILIAATLTFGMSYALSLQTGLETWANKTLTTDLSDYE